MSELLRGEPAGVPRARMMLQRAHWAASAFASYPPDAVTRIVEAVAEVAYQNARTVCRMGCSRDRNGRRRAQEDQERGVLARDRRDATASTTTSSARIDAERRIVEVPRPAGVSWRSRPSTNPVSSVYFKVLLSLLTRNAIVVSPHPAGARVLRRRARLLADAAVRAGAPDGCIQVVEEPTIPLIEALMSDVTTDVIVATGGSAVVRAAYRSGNPAIGVGPGNVPGARRRDGRPRARGALHRRLEGLRQLDPVHERVGADRRGAHRRRARARARQAGRAHLLGGRGRQAARHRLPRRPLAARPRRQGRADDRPRRRTSASHRARACSSRRSRSSCPRSRSPARSCSPCSGSCASPTRGAVSTPHARWCASAAPGTRPSSTRATPRDDHGLRRRRQRAARRRQRGRQHRLLGLRDRARALDDDRHGLLRAQLARREPRAEAPRELDADRLRLRPRGAVRSVRGPRAVERAARAAAPYQRDERRTDRTTRCATRSGASSSRSSES